MRFTKPFWAGIADGSVTIAFRRWKRPTVVAGRLLLAATALILVVALSGRRIPRSGRAVFYFIAISITGSVEVFEAMIAPSLHTRFNSTNSSCLVGVRYSASTQMSRLG